MPDLFDNIFNRIGAKINGGKTTHHYQGSSQVNTGRFYSFHENGTNNKYWMPTSKSFDNTMENFDNTNKERKTSDASVESEGMVMPRSRMNSAVSDILESLDT
mmetsp:Transcript_6728/g.6635  ORF Transcript_6728/g.6635 Transcript_6728/m.6635 type:complete len:103 (-) Transcript_6728:463-771(-)